MGRQKKKADKKNPTLATQNHAHFSNASIKKDSSGYLPPSGKGMQSVPSAGALLHAERHAITIFNQPFRTIYYCIAEIIMLCLDGIKTMIRHKRSMLLGLSLIISTVYLYYMPGQHQNYIKPIEKALLWCIWWLALGIASSIGLGSGLHTFLIYLGPHIARVTLAAYECNSLNFPEPPYPDDVTCPEHAVATGDVSLWAILNKVRLEALMWGAGTALGELPPYFVARAARISGVDPDDEDYKEFLSLQEANSVQKQGVFDHAKLWIEGIVKKTGFFGILVFASIPNPLFDFAGITCGHFLIPFWTFFGATLLGKALIKAHLQMFIVIFVFSQHHVENLISNITLIPRIGSSLERILMDFFNKQKSSLHRTPGDAVHQESGILQQLISLVVVVMIIGFFLSMAASLAQRYHKRITSDAKKRK